MTIAEQARQVIELMLPQLQADGYTVYIEPSRHLLPPSMAGYVPAAIALGPKKLAIEVVIEGVTTDSTVAELRERFRATPGWELLIYYARPAGPQKAIEPVAKGAIAGAISSIETLLASGQAGPALLVGWATFEALGRALMPAAFARPQTPARLIEVLAGEGHVTPSQADLLRPLATSRNQLVHGGLDVGVSPVRMAEFVVVLKDLQRQVEAAARDEAKAEP